MKHYRNQGAIGAILDEYENALQALCKCIQPLSSENITRIIDTTTTDEDCRSIQTILAHVVSSGFNYAIAIRNWLGENLDYTEPELLATSSQYIQALDTMFVFNEQVFEAYPKLELIEKDPDKKIHSRWGQRYDVDQLLEHAIVHVLRHRRQIERFIIKLDK